MRKLVLAVLLLGASLRGASAQPAAADKDVTRLAPPLPCDRITINDGLPNSNIRAMVQDPLGFMWFGTEDGLARYDGTRMRVYRPIEKDPTSISSSYITSLAIDASGKLWVGTSEQGINLYDPKTDKFTRFAKGKGGLSSEGVIAMTRDFKDRMWFAMSGGGLNRFEAKDSTFAEHVTKPLDIGITSLDADLAGNLWLGTASEGVIRWNPEDSSALAFAPDADLDISAVSITSILASSKGTIWIGTDGEGLLALDEKAKSVKRYRAAANDPKTLTDDHINVLFEDKAGTLWVGTPNGLNRMEAAGTFVQFQHDLNDPGDPTRVAFPAIESMYQDRGGVMWLGGFTVGICKFDEYRMAFGHRKTRTHANSFFEDTDGSVWVGTYNGIYHFDWSANRSTFYHTLGRYVGDDEPVSLESVWVTAIHRDRRGILWIALLRRGLVAFDPKTETYKRYLPDPENAASLPVDTVFDIAEDELGRMWLATWGGGLVRLEPQSEVFTAITTEDTSNGLTSDHYYTLYPDPIDKKLMWLGTAKGGLVRYDTSAGTASSFRHTEDPASLSSDDVVTIYRAPDNTMWAGTFGGGINKIDLQTNKVQRFTLANSGLTNNTVFGILPGDDGTLWMSTNGSGLVRMNVKDSTFETYDIADGIQGNEFSQGAFMRSKSGLVFFGGAGGFNAFKPGDIKRDTYKPPIAVTGFKVGNQEVQSSRPPWMLPKLEVSYTDSFEVEFAALSYAASARNRYAYKLEGFDDKFIESNRPFATYTKLAGGNYKLKVRAANRHGTWTETELTLAIHVTPPFWRTWPAYLIYVLLLAALVTLAIRMQRQRIARVEREGRLAVVERDLALTGAVQTGFLPEHNAIATQHVQLYGHYRPADACSGDWWWYEPMPNGRHLIMVGDVTGHGPGPAMVTAAVATAFRVMIESGVQDIHHCLERLNHEVLRVAKTKYHMTMAVLELEDSTGNWILHSAGSPPMLSLARNGKHRVHFCPGTPLGTENGFETGRIEGRLEQNERLLLYTDGIPEIILANGNVMGMRRFAQYYEQTRSQQLREAADAIVMHADAARGNSPQQDDWTFTMIEWA